MEILSIQMQFLSLSFLASFAAATTHLVEMAGVRFLQPDIKIAVGDIVTWRFESRAHSVVQTADPSTCTPMKNGYNTGSLKSVDVSKQFNETGVFYYICDVGPHCAMGMKGVVTIV